ncbi:MAG: hypothetical protein VB853_03230 [Pirellulales bacterium]
MSDSTTKIRVRTPVLEDERETSPGPAVEWTFFPLFQQRKVAVVVCCGLLTISALVGWVSGKLYLAAIAALLGGVTVWRLFIPVHYQIDNVGITQLVWRRSRTTAWHSIGSLRELDEGILMMPKSRLGELAPLRGIFLPWGSHRDDVLACVEFHAPYLCGAGENERSARNKDQK